MSVTSYIFGILAALLVLGIVIEMLRRGRLRERHAIGWLVAGIFALVAGLFPETAVWAAVLIGVEVPINLLFFVSIALLFIVSLQFSSELTGLEEKTRTLAERIALLEMRLEEAEAGRRKHGDVEDG